MGPEDQRVRLDRAWHPPPDPRVARGPRAVPTPDPDPRTQRPDRGGHGEDPTTAGVGAHVADQVRHAGRGGPAPLRRLRERTGSAVVPAIPRTRTAHPVRIRRCAARDRGPTVGCTPSPVSAHRRALGGALVAGSGMG